MNKKHSPKYSSRNLYSSSKKNGAASKSLSFFKMKRGKVTLVFLSVILLLAGTLLILDDYFISKIKYTSLDQFKLASSVPPDEVDTSIDPNAKTIAMQYGTGKILSNANIQNILLIGSDKRAGETSYGRSDSMMIVSVDKMKKQIKITSLLRDTYLKIEGTQDNRINEAYGYGGPKLLVDTIQKNFRVKIDNYVEVDFSAFTKLIDLVGGVNITLTNAEANELNNNSGTYFSEDGTRQTGSRVTFRAGSMTLNGTSALGYSRIRHIDSDFGRTQRQRNVITALVNSMKHSSPGTILNVLNEVLPLVQTDLSRDQVHGLAMQAPSLMNNSLQQCHLPANGAYTDEVVRGMAVLVPNIEENKNILWKFIYNYQS